jgi:fimbrial chaperone protein
VGRGTTLAAAAFALLALLALSNVAAAGGFSLSPIRLTIPARDVAGSITATNTGDAPIVLQAVALAWLQQDGREVREETRALIVNPPIFKLAPGEQQIVRIASRTGAPAVDEQTFRLVVSEIPTEGAPVASPTLRLTLAMDVPVFLEPRQAGASSMHWRVDTGSSPRLIAENRGTRHFRIHDVEYLADGKAVHKAAAAVVLPKSWLALELPSEAGNARTLQIRAKDDAGQPVTIDVPPPAR